MKQLQFRQTDNGMGTVSEWWYECDEHGEFVHSCYNEWCKEAALCPECGEEGNIPRSEQ
jgi:hypothetical protein